MPLAVASAATLSLASPADAKASPANLPAVKASIADLISSDAEARGDGTALTGTFVRLAWHCSGSYSAADNSGGSNGSRMRFEPEAKWGANAGLKMARDKREGVKEKHPEISYADL